MSINYPPDRTENFDKSKNYREFVFRDKKFLTGNDMNNFQSLLNSKREDLANAIFSNGDLVDGGQPNIDPITGVTTLTGGQLYVDGEFFEFADQTGITVPTNTPVELGVFIDKQVYGAAEDGDMVDQSVGLKTSGLETQRRVKYIVVWGWKTVDGASDSGDTGTFFPVHLVENGVLVTQTNTGSSVIREHIAEYDRDSTGGYYVVEGLELTFDEFDSVEQENVFSLSLGKAYVNGFQKSVLSTQRLVFPSDPDLALIQNEAQIMNVVGGEAVITPNNNPLNDIQEVSAKLIKTEAVTRGVVANTADDVNEGGIFQIDSIPGYTQGVDYQLAGGQVDWSLPGTEPSAGSSYDVTYRFIKDIPIKTGSLTPTQFIIEDQDGGNETLIDGETITIDYNYRLRRIDLLEMTENKEFVRIKGISHRSNPIRPFNTPGNLELALIRYDWINDPVIQYIADVTIPMGQLNNIVQQMLETKLQVAELAQLNKLRLIDGQANSNLFVDILNDDSQRARTPDDDAQLSANMLCLPVTFEDYYPDNANNLTVQTLDFTLETVVSQEKQTGQIAVNPYDSYEAPPKLIEVEEKVDNDVTQFTAPFIARGSQPPSPPFTVPGQTDVDQEQVSPVLSIERAGATTNVTPPSSFDQAKEIASEWFQNNRHNPNRVSKNRKQKKKVKRLTIALLNGENPSTIKVNGKPVTVNVT